jgi:hypothetical protein
VLREALDSLHHRAGALLGGLALALLAAGAVAWLAPLYVNPSVWAVRVGAPLAGAAVAAVLLLAPPARRVNDDLLARAVPDYFERGGFCFGPRFVTDGGSCYFCVYFQNHFSGPATARIDIRPDAGWFGLNRPALAPADIAVECPGGAFGVAWMQYGVPRELQGQRVEFRVAAGVDYLQGPGRRLSSGAGTPVGPLRGGRPGASQFWVRLPVDVPVVGPATVEVATAILWQPDLPTGGFQVLPVKPAA